MDTLQIDRNQALKAYNNGDAASKSLLETLFGDVFKSIIDRTPDLAAVFRIKGIDPDAFWKQWQDKGLEDDEIDYKIMKMISEVLNEGWIPDYNNPNEYKWVLWWWMNDKPGFRLYDAYYVISFSAVGSRLCFKSEKLALHAAKIGLEVYKGFFTR